MTDLNKAARLSVAPMIDWTDSNCRIFHRQFSRNALLYTEMVTAPAVIHGPRARLLGYRDAEHPVALQLGGADPAQLREAVRIAADWNYDEINLNCGCPSDRVQSGAFGAVLMRQPDLVAEILSEMIAASPVEVTLKCRIGVDDQEPSDILPAFLEKVAASGVRRVIIHARKAWLQGLSPKENRDIPPLDYDLVFAMKAAFPDLHISLNGGVKSLAEAQALLDRGLDGVMIGRAAYHEPADILGQADPLIWGEGHAISAEEAVHAMFPVIEDHLRAGGRLHQITRHMLGAFAGRPGARQWRRILSEEANRDGAGLHTVEKALAAMDQLAA
ncbi:tRNA dihydrouridine(20/20a) synthase DusA [Ketogulonicigenium vulgare]|uniref:tRNA-dihydrouridine(20/20a) synthase n=1 Tax=Ketogulonicigenium vulgare (strain WSH-001) TaxID=759362 RepID=F9Y788_KETVW|nr:tRNA dihydrouridine(20/20a) synthase DusA [Ketogulonicigenium vulgare]ADO42831.1 tRNA-dihydrouridine synthase A [Ketogulonicigenium vulgare Y25]AEM41016.1 tRNA-dihydrouridine synthase (NifR3-like protein) protein [Ketogulonicigenium vulgare WSH-001]ALJ81167.1 tRNA-dihydrouridine synthase A [Ketogulonicigenium vulgare]ANW33913.1 tRNA dihydrouridine synthase DusA [Ketogulonicigenium vulgare]AOZ54743.1 tRNA-dihydrouridine synthase A [Ketogulonicigenium vulgare]